jgi:hypothetical protein
MWCHDRFDHQMFELQSLIGAKEVAQTFIQVTNNPGSVFCHERRQSELSLIDGSMANVVSMRMRNHNRPHGIQPFSVLHQTKLNLAGTDPGIKQDGNAIGFHIDTITPTTGLQYKHFHVIKPLSQKNTIGIKQLPGAGHHMPHTGPSLSKSGNHKMAITRISPAT